ncbi:MAG: hypothetical protein P1U56_20860 [Saprospiraceae bacterium]|nr:hypothetical protein [Saprospiraceae bacterium]
MKYTIYLLFAFALCFASCGGDDGPSGAECNSLGFTAEYEVELTAISEAATVWANDPTEANCDALKDAYNDYLDSLEKWEDCANELNQFNEWQAAIDAARQSVSSIC